jgi:HK97 gp10 family phage protein
MPSVEIVGEAALAKKIREIGGRVRRAALQAVQDETLEIVQDMRRQAPRDSGDLVDGIQAEIDAGALEGRAVSTAAHTKYVVHGTSKMAAQDFMTPAAERSRRRFPKRLKDAVADELLKL